MSTISRVSPTGWTQVDNTFDNNTVTPTGWEYISGISKLYAVAYPSNLSNPTRAQVVAGLNGSGGSATWKDNIPAPPTTTTSYIWPKLVTGLTEGTSYKIAYVWYNGILYSNVAVTGSFTTLGTAPVASNSNFFLTFLLG